MKIKRTAKFHTKLTLKQVAHCKELKINPNNIIKSLISQAEHDYKHPKNSRMWCAECSEIASRLGLNDKLSETLFELYTRIRKGKTK